ncbi:974_t:CDS:2 [Funneliformis mosseae]|uniref:974_t:CDS:1 n=1 Tax=Funneliformis mosseae TaxID=27381 RepID=A0A9N9H4H8_FUNMO|nr:974_t:CDS:2 [Funneliformis mosseae]
MDDFGLLIINMIIMKAIPKEDREVCIKPSIVTFALAVCKDIADIYNDLKNNESLKDYNDTVEEETQEPYYDLKILVYLIEYNTILMVTV